MLSYWLNRYKKQGYDHYGATWNIADGVYNKKVKERKKFFKEWTKGKEFENVLDFGCGNGYMSGLFKFYLGIDVVPDLIELNKKKYPNKRFMLLQYAFETGDIIYNKWDLILCISVLQYLSDADVKVKLVMFHGICDNLIIQDSTIKSDDHTFYRPHKELKDLCKDAGFKVYKEISKGSRWLWLK